jgi:hypothetical protein
MAKQQFRTPSDILKFVKQQEKNGSGIASAQKNKKSGIIIITNEMLIEAAGELRDCIQARLEEYYDHWGNTGDLLKALKCRASVDTDGDHMSIGLYFDAQLDQAKSFVSPAWNEGWRKSLLVSEGWEVKRDVWFKDIWHLGFYEGFNFINDGIKDWMASSKYARYISVSRNSFGVRFMENGIDYF